eukprot:7186905-Pyramimonas_sp.AAC.1
MRRGGKLLRPALALCPSFWRSREIGEVSFRCRGLLSMGAEINARSRQLLAEAYNPKKPPKEIDCVGLELPGE